MKSKIIILVLTCVTFSLLGSTNNPALTSTNPLFSVMVNSNGVLQKPASFFLTNKTAIGTGLGITNKGDLLAGTGSNIAVRTVGAQGQVLTADTNSPTGLSWLQGGAGSVTNVGFAADTNVFIVTGSPITNTGTISLSMRTQAIGSIFAAPLQSNGPPVFRAIANADLPIFINPTNIGSGVITSNEWNFLDGLTTNLTTELSNRLSVSTVSTKGDLWGWNGSSVVRIPAGVNGQILSVDMSTASGLKFISGSGVGTVTSVGLQVPSQFGVSNSPVTSSGTIVMTNTYQAANTFWSGPSSGSPAGPTFRTMTTDDLPAAIPWSKISTGLVDTNEFGYLDGLTNNVQNQLNAKISSQWTTSGSNVIYSSGKVGISSILPITPLANLHVFGAYYDPNTTNNELFRLETPIGVGLRFGGAESWPYEMWCQVANLTSVGSPLSLQPLGGNVGIGIRNPSALLHVNGTAITEGLTTVKGTLTLGGYDEGNPAWTVSGTSNLTAARYGGGNLNEVFIRANRLVLDGKYSNDILIGENAGVFGNTGSDSVIIGDGAGYAVTNYANATVIGRYAGVYNNNISGSIIIGYTAGGFGKSQASSVMVGANAGSSALNADRSSFIGTGVGWNATNSTDSFIAGFYAGYDAHNSSYSVMVGSWSGAGATNSSKSIYLGYTAGQNVSRNNTLIIDSQASAVGTNAFMYGEMDNKMLRINGSLDVTNRFTLNQYLPITTNLQVLVPGSKTNTLYITNGLIMRISNP